jgi:streptogramin lyase
MVRILMPLSVVASAGGCGHGGAPGVDASGDARDSAAGDAGVDLASADLSPDQAPEADTATGKECPASPVITEFPAGGATDLMGIARGRDGNVWFTDSGKIAVGMIGRLVP